MLKAEEKLKEIMNTHLAKAYLIDEKENVFKRFCESGTEI